MTDEELQAAAMRLDNGQNASGLAADFLSAVSASCRDVDHSAEAAAFNRRQYFALEDLYGCFGIFFSLSPCDQTTFRIRLYAEPGRPHELPHLNDLCNDEDVNR